MSGVHEIELEGNRLTLEAPWTKCLCTWTCPGTCCVQVHAGVSNIKLLLSLDPQKSFSHFLSFQSLFSQWVFNSLRMGFKLALFKMMQISRQAKINEEGQTTQHISEDFPHW